LAEGLIISEQYTIVNAPAGSGKTTALSKSINDLMLTANNSILCITYTNRAAEQLKEKIINESVQIGTIHSFIGSFMRAFFKLRPIVNYFYEFFDENITKILDSKSEGEIAKLNKYKERYGLKEDYILTKQTLIENTVCLEYGETQFTSFLYGSLSHDDLLIFSKAVLEKFPKLNKTISQRFSHIFIDEYQDTNSEILELFYNACLNSDTKLILLGDEMQQIYKDRVEDFQEVINRHFVRDNSLNNNWRSQGNIVKLLNNLYCDPSYKQHPQRSAEEKPRLLIVDDFSEIEISSEVLQLVLYNSDLFKALKAYNLFNAYNEKYKVFDKYNTKEILLNLTVDSPDDLITLLVFIVEISDLFDNKQFAQLIQKVTSFKFTNKEIWNIKSHSDKTKVAFYLNEISQQVKKDITIEELLNFLRDNEIVDTYYIDMVIGHIEEESNFKNKIYEVKLNEFINCYREMKNPKFSTQHAVKGEGYDHVALKVSDGNSSPNVKMYLYLELLSKGLFNYEDFSNMNKEIRTSIKNFNKSIGKKISQFKAADYKQYEDECTDFIDNIKRNIIVNKRFYEEFFACEFSKFEDKPNVTNLKNCIKAANRIDGMLLAYKLFYVGCSRAKKNLDVYVISSSIIHFKREFISSMEELNFEVVCSVG
jgi:DNA helicase II / ATP-dependent DNA helicase PcrA